MNLLKTELLKLREAFDKMEGNGFFDEAIRTLSPYKLLRAITWVLEKHKEAEEYAHENWKIGGDDWIELRRRYIVNDVYDFITIYGSGGGHRYFVNREGEIKFSSGHSLNEDVEKARETGFRIH